jgi:hypothetical protein
VPQVYFESIADDIRICVQECEKIMKLMSFEIDDNLYIRKNDKNGSTSFEIVPSNISESFYEQNKAFLESLQTSMAPNTSNISNNTPIFEENIVFELNKSETSDVPLNESETSDVPVVKSKKFEGFPLNQSEISDPERKQVEDPAESEGGCTKEMEMRFEC